LAVRGGVVRERSGLPLPRPEPAWRGLGSGSGGLGVGLAERGVIGLGIIGESIPASRQCATLGGVEMEKFEEDRRPRGTEGEAVRAVLRAARM